MKNAMKRIMSLALAVMLLISVVPAAFASETDKNEVTVTLKYDGKEETKNVEISGETEAYTTLVSAVMSDWSAYDITKAWSSQQQKDLVVAGTSTIYADDHLSVILTAKGDGTPDVTEPEPVEPINIVVKVNNSDNVVWTDTKVPSNGEYALVENLLSYCWNSDWENVYSYSHAWSHDKQAILSKTAKVYAGDTLYIMLETEAVEDTEDKDEEVAGGRDDDGNWHYSYKETNNKDPYPVLLKVYLKNSGNGFTYSDTFNITTKAGEDNVLTFAEVYNYLLNHYKSTKSTGIEMDGIYLYEGNFNSAWAEDKKYPKIYNLDKARYSEDDITLAVVLENAKAKSSNADPSNPKTGDDIMIAATTMTLAGAALVAAYELKKRKMI